MKIQIKTYGKIARIEDNQNGDPIMVVTSIENKDFEIPVSKSFLESISISNLIYKSVEITVLIEGENNIVNIELHDSQVCGDYWQDAIFAKYRK